MVCETVLRHSYMHLHFSTRNVHWALSLSLGEWQSGTETCEVHKHEMKRTIEKNHFRIQTFIKYQHANERIGTETAISAIFLFRSFFPFKEKEREKRFVIRKLGSSNRKSSRLFSLIFVLSFFLCGQWKPMTEIVRKKMHARTHTKSQRCWLKMWVSDTRIGDRRSSTKHQHYSGARHVFSEKSDKDKRTFAKTLATDPTLSNTPATLIDKMDSVFLFYHKHQHSLQTTTHQMKSPPRRIIRRRASLPVPYFPYTTKCPPSFSLSVRVLFVFLLFFLCFVVLFHTLHFALSNINFLFESTIFLCRHYAAHCREGRRWGWFIPWLFVDSYYYYHHYWLINNI